MNSPKDFLIHLDDVKKVFLTDEIETHALSGIYLDIGFNEYLAIAGPSGCGKSTLLSILGLLDSPTEGSYSLNGRQVGIYLLVVVPRFATERSDLFSRTSI